MRLPILLASIYLALYLGASVFHMQLISDARSFWIFQLSAMIAFPVVAWWYLIARYRMPAGAFGWGQDTSQSYEWRACLSDYVWLVAGWAFGLVVVMRLLWLFLWPVDQLMQSATMRPQDGFWWFAVGMLWSIEPAIVEESFFRGFLWTLFDRYGYGRSRPSRFIFWSGILFGLGHLPQGLTVVLTMTLIGFFLAWHYSKVRRVLPFALAHFSVNLFVLFAT